MYEFIVRSIRQKSSSTAPGELARTLPFFYAIHIILFLILSYLLILYKGTEKVQVY